MHSSDTISTLHRFTCIGAVLLLSPAIACASTPKAELVSVAKIWDSAPHNAFTDLVRWNDRFYCAFREGQGHAGDRGKLRIIVSDDGNTWESAGVLSDERFDLRDAALAVMPDGRLMVLGGAQSVQDGTRQTGTFVSFSKDGTEFTAPHVVVPLGRWLWRVTWQGDHAYGVSYGTPENPAASALHKTSDGLSYETTTADLFSDGGWPTEARLRFAADGTCYCLHRRDGQRENTAQLGVAQPPYQRWEWHDLKLRLGGPNFLQLPDGTWIAAGRLYDGGPRTELLHLDVDRGVMTPILRLPSAGDTSYPGMVWHEGVLWVSYYSSHEGRTNIYLAKVQFPGLDTAAETLEHAIQIGNRRELFVDRHLIERLDNAELRLHRPRAAEPVLAFDQPWEGPFCGYTTVIQDDDVYRMYYRGLPKAGADGSNAEVTCYAESRDGISWVKPNLGLYEINGTRENNVILSGQAPASHNFSPFLDANTKAASDARYKALGGGATGLIAFKSADGIRWTRLRQDPVFTQGIFDSQNVSFWSEAEHVYVCYFRTWTQRGYGGYRTVSRTTSNDFIHWTDPVPMTFGDTPAEHIYTNQTGPYFRAPHIYVGIAARFMPGRKILTQADATRLQVDPGYFGDCSDAVLLTSRGLNRYDRTFMESFIRPGLGLQNWVSRTNYPALGVVPTGASEMSVYLQRNYGQPTAYLQRFEMRVDGFSSLHAGYNPGELLTKIITLPDKKQGCDELVLNMSTSAAGSIRVELQDDHGQVIPGFSLAAAVELIGDSLDRVVTWRGTPDLSALAARQIRLRLVLKDADLYSFQLR